MEKGSQRSEKKPLPLPEKANFSRFGGRYSSFSMMVMNSFLEHEEVSRQLNSIDENDEDLVLVSNDLHFLQEKLALEIYVFSALAIESYIYEIAAIELSDSFVRDHLDKLSIVDKYVVVPQLIAGVVTDKSEEWYFLLKKLTAQRNELVHSKSRHLDLVRLQSDEPYADSVAKKNWTISTKDAVKLLFLIDNYIRALPNSVHYFPFLASKSIVISSEKHHSIFQIVYETIFA